MYCVCMYAANRLYFTMRNSSLTLSYRSGVQRRRTKKNYSHVNFDPFGYAIKRWQTPT